MSYRFCGCLLAFHLVPASKQPQNLYDIHLMLYVQSWTPDDGRRDRPKHVECFNVLLTVLLSKTLVNDQLDAQLLYLITLFTVLYMF